MLIQGLDQLERKLRELELSVQRKALRDGVRLGAELIAEEASRLAPVDTGELQERIVVSMRDSESDAKTVVARIGPARRVFYGIFDEYGTAHMTAQPFLGPAFEAKKEEALRVTSEAFTEAINEATR